MSSAPLGHRPLTPTPSSSLSSDLFDLNFDLNFVPSALSTTPATSQSATLSANTMFGGVARSSSPPPVRSVQRACDQCHSRKVKCNGGNPCARCVKGTVDCTFDKPILPKGPPPKRRGEAVVPRRRVKFYDRPASKSGSATLRPSAAICELTATPSEVVASTTLLDLWTISTPACTDENAASGASGSSVSDDDSDSEKDTFQLPEWLASTPTVEPPRTALSVMRSRAVTPNGFDILGLNNLNGGLPSFGGGLLGGNSNPFGGGLGGIGLLNIPGLAPSPMLDMPFTAPAEASPILSLTLESFVKPQLDVFYQRVYPMMPVFDAAWMHAKLADKRSMGDKQFAAFVLAMVALSLVHPLNPDEMEQKEARARQASTLLDEVCRLRSGWNYGCQNSVESVLTSYLFFGTLFELGHAEGARFRLLESIIMAQSMRLGDINTYRGLGADETKRRMRMYWILAITERAYALQRSGTIIFTGPIATSSADHGEGCSLHHLARVFTVLDADIIACWNGECDRASCTTLTTTRAVSILRRLQGSAADVFGDEDGLMSLTECQKADLLITWQWLRNRIWRLAAAHGLCNTDEREVNCPPELGVGYVVDVAATTVAICRRLSHDAMEKHGQGFVEKLVDIASIITELLGNSAAMQASVLAVVHSGRWGEVLESLGMFVTRHRAGRPFATVLAQAMNLVASVRLLSGTEE